MVFAVVFPKTNDISLAGGHTGPPLQRRENLLNKDVGEHLCVLPHNNSEDAFLSIFAKICFLQCNHIMIALKQQSKLKKGVSTIILHFPPIFNNKNSVFF